ncbi:MAG: ABC transporter ATP-binding protein [Candidatus Bathyarchaeia archaeon]
MLSVINITKKFGGLVVLKDVSFEVKEKEITCLIGPNGAGKTTMFNIISGVLPATSGEIKFLGKRITGLHPDKICRMGIGRTFQLVRPFLAMTALENVMCGSLFGPKNAKNLEEARSESLKYLDYLGLASKKDIRTEELTLADRKKIEIATSLAANVKLLLLDEVIAGLNPTETNQLMDLITKLRDDLGITVFWIEHVMNAVMNCAERIVVINFGEKIAYGTPREIANDPKVIETYLGKKYEI